MRLIYLCLVACVVLAACKESGNKESTATVATDSINNQPLYPYPQYIADQILYVDSTPLAIEMLVFENGKRVDSTIIDRAKFKELANAFAQPDLNRTEFRKQYEEESFQDLTLNTVTFSINAKNPDLPLRQADVLLNPTTKKVKNVIIKKQITTAEGNETQNLLWVNNMNFQISATLTKKDGTVIERLTKVIWDKPLQ